MAVSRPVLFGFDHRPRSDCYGFASYRAAGFIVVWNPPAWTRHIVVALMWPASIMVAAAYIPGNIKRVLKHPLLVAVKTWAFAHLCANGDLGGMIVFGSILAWAVYDRITLKRRGDAGVRQFRSAGATTILSPSSSAPSSIWRLALCSIPWLSACRRSPRRHWRGKLGVEIMSAQNDTRRLSAPDIRARKGGEPLVCLTSYHAHTARIVDAYCDVILVGDLLGMVMHGLETTVPVTLEMMILQGHAVMRGSKRAFVVIDMPFGSYEASKEQAFALAARIMKETGCGAIKIEGGRRMAETIAFLTERGVPVMGACRLDAAGYQYHRLVPRSGPRRKRLGADRGRCAGGGGCRRFFRRA